jgi:ABC-2 type transport system permease protein
MNITRVMAVVVRYLLEIPRDFFRLFDLTFYPTMDIILWGFMSLWVQTGSQQSAQIGPLILLSLVFWMLVENANREIAFNLTEELYAHNLVNILVTPLHLDEWLIAVVMLAVIRSLAVFAFCSFVIWLLRDISVLGLGPVCLIFGALLVMSGVAIGIGISALMMRWGRKISTFIWSIPYLILSFSAVFYPINLLPPWAQMIGRAMPISYVFESLRQFVSTGIINWTALIISFCLNIVYLIVAIMLFALLFDRSKNSGLAQLEYY